MIKIDKVIKLTAYMIGLIGFVPVASYLPIFTSIFILLLISIAFFIDFRGNKHISRKFLTTIALFVIGGTIIKIIQSGDIVIYAVQALSILLVVKFFEEKEFRDHMQIIAITLFLLASSSLFSLSMWFLVYVFIALFLITSQIVLLTFHIEDKKMQFEKKAFWRLLMTSLPMPLIAVPAAIIIFFILPRTDFPLFSSLNQQSMTKSGFSDSVELGSVSDIQSNDSVAFRVKMKKIPANKLYWRGILLDTYDNNIWKSSGDTLSSKSSRKVIATSKFQSTFSSEIIEQQIFMEPDGSYYLYALNTPYQISGYRHIIKTGNIFKIRKPLTKRIKYDALSRIDANLIENSIDTNRYLKLPDMVDKIISLANDLKMDSSDKTAQYTLDYFLDGTFTYATKGLVISETPLKDFLFTSMIGNCEFFASSMAVLLRLNGIPTRVVGGFKGGYYNETLGYYKIPNSNAHVWVEAWIDGVWKTFDPTPASIQFFTKLPGNNIQQIMSQFADSVIYYWNTLIIGYDFSTQLEIARGIGNSFKDFINIKTIVILILIFVGGYGVVFIMNRRGRFEFNKDKRLIIKFEKLLQSKGFVRLEGEGLEMLVTRVTNEDLRIHANKFIDIFQSNFYRDRDLNNEDIQKMKKLLGKMSNCQNK